MRDGDDDDDDGDDAVTSEPAIFVVVDRNRRRKPHPHPHPHPQTATPSMHPSASFLARGPEQKNRETNKALLSTSYPHTTQGRNRPSTLTTMEAVLSVALHLRTALVAIQNELEFRSWARYPAFNTSMVRVSNPKRLCGWAASAHMIGLT